MRWSPRSPGRRALALLGLLGVVAAASWAARGTAKVTLRPEGEEPRAEGTLRPGAARAGTSTSAAPPAVATLEELLTGVESGTDQRGLALETAVARLAERVCKEPGLAPSLSVHAVLLAASNPRAAHAALNAMGRCGEKSVLMELIRLLEDDRTPTNIRDAIILSLAQRREATVQNREGAGIAKSDVIVDGPISEEYVRRAIAGVFKRVTLSEDSARNNSVAVTNAVIALAGSVGLDGSVFALLREYADSPGGNTALVVSALQLSAREPVVLAYAQEVLSRKGLPDDTFQQTLILLLRSNQRAAFEFGRDVMESPTRSDLERALVVRALSGVVVIPDTDVLDVERFCEEAWQWARQVAQVSKTSMIPEAIEPNVPIDTPPLVLMLLANIGRVRPGITDTLCRVWSEAVLWILLNSSGGFQYDKTRAVRECVSSCGIESAKHILDGLIANKATDGATIVAALSASKARLSAFSEWGTLETRWNALVLRLSPEEKSAVGAGPGTR